MRRRHDVAFRRDGAVEERFDFGHDGGDVDFGKFGADLFGDDFEDVADGLEFSGVGVG